MVTKQPKQYASNIRKYINTSQKKTRTIGGLWLEAWSNIHYATALEYVVLKMNWLSPHAKNSAGE